MKRKKNITFLFNLLVVLLLLTGCIQTTQTPPQTNQTLNIALITESSINPYGSTILPNIFEGLVSFDATFQITPRLAASWTNPTDLIWRFYLQENVTFHDGSSFDVNDVIYSFYVYEDVFNTTISNLNAINNHTLEITTYEPTPKLLQQLARSLVIFPENLFNNTENNIPIGTGAYRFVEYNESHYLVLTRNEAYWNDLPNIKTVNFTVITDQQERIDSLLEGNTSIIQFNVDPAIEELEEDSRVQIVTFPALSTYLIGFDMRENNSTGYPDGENPTSHLLVRKAIYHAIDIEPLINGPFMGYATPASQFLTPYIYGYNPDIKRLEYDPELARSLLNQAGYPNGFNITLDTITYLYDYNEENSRLIAEQLREVGINVTLNNLTVNKFNQKVIYNKNSSFWLVGWNTISSDGEFVYKNFIMSAGEEDQGYYNSGHYQNSEVNQLGIQAENEMNGQVRLHLLQEGFEIALTDDIMSIPLFTQQLFILTSPDITLPPRADLKLLIEEISFTN